MNFKLKVHNIWEFGQKKDFKGHPHQDDSMFPEFGYSDDSSRLFILCDGAGDNYDGHIASNTVCRVMSQVILHNNYDENTNFTINDFKKALDVVFDTINHKDKCNAKISTTLAFLKFHKEGVFIAHIGNSRVYQIRPGISGDETQIVFQTIDHTYVNDLVRIGMISPIEAKYHPQRNVVTRSIQPGSNKSKADIYQIKDIKAGDYFFMCTDGMVEQVDMDEGTSLKSIFSDMGGNDDNKVRVLRSITEMNRDNHSAFLIHVLDVESPNEKNLKFKTNNISDIAPQTLPIGTIINSGSTSYTIKKVLGIGSFGITYLALGGIKIGNVTFEVPFAIKEHFMESCLRDKNGTTVLCVPRSKKIVDLSRKDFLTEARRLQQLCNNTKYIVKVNEAFEANGTAYYVMEYLSGGSLKAVTKHQAIDYMLQIADAVKVLHDNKILHLDIKPSNVILKVDEDTLDTYPVLIDFGITKHFDDSGRPTTSPKSKGASLGYAPIEQYDEVTTFSPAIDIYAMGATLFYLLTGQNPPNASKLCYNNKILRETLSQAQCDEFIPFITKAMAPNYQDRFGDIRTFIKALYTVQIGINDNLGVFDHQKTYISNSCGSIPKEVSKILLPIIAADKWGYMDHKGKIVIPTRFDDANKFCDNLAVVELEGQYGFIDSNGDFKIKPIYEDARDFCEGLAAVKKNGKFGFIDKDGEMIIPFMFDDILWGFSEELASFELDHKFGYINKKGEIIIDPRFSAVDNFSEGYAAILINDKYGYINKKGEIIIEPQFESCGEFKNDLAAVKLGNKYGYINRAGTFVIAPRFEYASSFSCGLACVQENDKYGYIGLKGKYVIPPTFCDFNDFINNFAIQADESGKEGIIDTKGRFLLPPVENRSIENIDGRYFIAVDDDGQFLIDINDLNRLNKIDVGIEGIKDNTGGSWYWE